MPATFEPIATTTLGSAAATITFSSIPNTYTDLRLVVVATASSGTNNAVFNLRFNSDTGSNYSSTYLHGDGSSAVSTRLTNETYIPMTQSTGFGLTTANPSILEADIFSYAGSTNKSVLYTQSNDKNGSGSVAKGVGLWRSTSAITSVSIYTYNFQYAAGTTATLYGIKSF